MESVFRIKASDLNSDFLKTIKKLFKNEGELEILIHPASDETSYLLSTESNRKVIEKSLAEKEGYSFTMDELKQYSNNISAGKKTKLNKVKIPK
jgi:hypothetical protein